MASCTETSDILNTDRSDDTLCSNESFHLTSIPPASDFFDESLKYANGISNEPDPVLNGNFSNSTSCEQLQTLAPENSVSYFVPSLLDQSKLADSNGFSGLKENIENLSDQSTVINSQQDNRSTTSDAIEENSNLKQQLQAHAQTISIMVAEKRNLQSRVSFDCSFLYVMCMRSQFNCFF